MIRVLLATSLNDNWILLHECHSEDSMESQPGKESVDTFQGSNIFFILQSFLFSYWTCWFVPWEPEANTARVPSALCGNGLHEQRQ